MFCRVAFGRHFPEKSMRRSLRHCTSTIDANIQHRRMLGCAADSGGGDRMMNPRRRAQVALALCGTVSLAGWLVASLAGPSPTRIEHAGAVAPTAAVPIEDRRGPSITTKVIDAPQAIALGKINVASADTATVAELVTG